MYNRCRYTRHNYENIENAWDSCADRSISRLAAGQRGSRREFGSAKPDKMTTCPVSGEKLGEMGKPYVFTYQGQEVKLCCSGCKKDFDKDPAKYVKKIQDAAAAQK